ncbi:primosomal protein [Amycolatopsis magusensis]|uniref:DsDNA-binding SOS-regulon protein n=1 Tax=Amycolatopsis magusensis TaxID=882444 RepID=A0ABS4PMI9_9PSEU|nr:primosomal protein [Amycolatopsis magusensis]MBP2180642.1 dsDNA-binding SOS-regulon protein [Amycolatopsis magusensis]MDI5980477.1 primosomal protein [Amycolatopsis magusensis]
MAQDIVPVELGLPQGDLVTLWAPRWREDGEEWEAFLGDEEDLYAFPDAAHLAAFVRTAEQHDLIDHPAWSVVPALNVPELIPDDDHSYDLVGVPELVAEEPDSWTIGELAEIVGIVRSLADVCELEEVHEVLDSCEGFSLLEQGRLPFTGREGERLWTDLSEAVSEKWDVVLDAIDGLVTVPDVDATLLEQTAEELATFLEESAEAEAAAAEGTGEDLDRVDSDDDEAEAEEEPLPTGFWAEVGIDPIKIVTKTDEYYTLRCFLDDEPVFLGSGGQIDVYGSPRALGRALAEPKELAGSDLAEVSTWDEVLAKATGGDLEIEVHPDNSYVLAGLDEDIAEGIDAIDPTQLELAVELLTDAADWAEDDSVAEALQKSESLGWLINFVIEPDPTRLAPSAPFDAEEGAWRKLVESFEDRLRTH